MKKIFRFISLFLVTIGFLFIISGIVGIIFTYKSVSQENITTPSDAKIPDIPVRGPISLKIQADTIRTHVLKMTDGKTFSEMPREIQEYDESGYPILNKEGKPSMIANTARDIWITATTLITSLNLGIIAYVFSGFLVLVGIFFVSVGVILFALLKEN